MYKQILQSVHNVEIWPIISLVIFFVFFVLMIIWVIKTDKKYIQKMKELPMNDGTMNDPSEKQLNL